MNDPEETIRFAGLTRHNNNDITNRATTVSGIDANDPPDTSFAEATRRLESARKSGVLWEVPSEVQNHIDVDAFNDEAPDGTEAVRTEDGSIAIRTDRFESIVSEDKLEQYAKGNFSNDDDLFQDALFHVPTNSYSIINPSAVLTPLKEKIAEEDIGDTMFGEIRTYRGGGRVHMDVLFDAYTIDDYNESGDDPLVFGVRVSWDFFGDTALRIQGFAQDTACSNSIRSLTDQEVIRHVGDQEELDETVENVLEQLGLLQDRLAELIEMAEDIELDLLELNFSEPFDHDDGMRAFYELAGFPSYLAEAAAGHALERADNRFMPNMTEVWDGATYALTHEFRGGEDTARARELVQTAGDMVQNPSQIINRVERNHRTRMAEQSGGEQATLEGESAHTAIENFSESVEQKKERFESKQEQLRQTLVAEASDDGGDGDADAEAAEA